MLLNPLNAASCAVPGPKGTCCCRFSVHPDRGSSRVASAGIMIVSSSLSRLDVVRMLPRSYTMLVRLSLASFGSFLRNVTALQIIVPSHVL